MKPLLIVVQKAKRKSNTDGIQRRESSYRKGLFDMIISSYHGIELK